MWAVVLGIGLPAAFRNPVAAALVMQWTLAQGTWLVTGNNMPLWLYLPTDLAVLAIFALKPHRMFGDWVAALIFPPMWVMYFASDWQRWWALWFMVILQFVSAAVGAVEEYKLARTKAVSFGLKPPGWFRVAEWASVKS